MIEIIYDGPFPPLPLPPKSDEIGPWHVCCANDRPDDSYPFCFDIFTPSDDKSEVIAKVRRIGAVCADIDQVKFVTPRRVLREYPAVLAGPISENLVSLVINGCESFYFELALAEEFATSLQNITCSILVEFERPWKDFDAQQQTIAGIKSIEVIKSIGVVLRDAPISLFQPPQHGEQRPLLSEDIDF